MGFVNNKKRSTVRGKVKKLSKKFNNSRKFFTSILLTAAEFLLFPLSFFLRAPFCKRTGKELFSATYEIMSVDRFDKGIYESPPLRG